MERPTSQAPATTTTQTGARRTRRWSECPAAPGQLTLIAKLADERGMTYEKPQTFEQAVAQIDRLKGRKRSHRVERRTEAKDVSAALAAGPASSVREDEVDGYGASYAARRSTGRGKRERDDECNAHGDERCRAIGRYPNPYHQGYPLGKGKTMSRADARRAYKRMLWERMKASPGVRRRARAAARHADELLLPGPPLRARGPGRRRRARGLDGRVTAEVVAEPGLARVVNVRDAERGTYTYIGRGSEWGNPYSHRPSKYPDVIRVATRDDAIKRYRAWLWERIKREGDP